MYPEGTISNNQALLTFKKGAFKDFKPVKILAVRFDKTKFIPFNDYLDDLRMNCLYMSNWVNYIDVYEFEGQYDPKYLNLD